MSATLALIRFELERRWLAPVVGFTFGLVTYAMPWFVTDVPAAELRTIVSSVAAALYLLLLCLTLGGSLAATDLGERRLSFSFARPLHPFTIGAARLTAALALALVSAALMLLPSLLTTGGFTLDEKLDTTELVVLAFGATAGTAALLLLSSAVLIAARSRSAWIVLELSALVAGGLLCERALRALQAFYLDATVTGLGFAVGAATLATLAVAYAAALSLGRTDLARTHRVQAVVVAALLAGTGAAALAYARDYVSPSFDEIAEQARWAEALGRDRYAITGHERGRDEVLTTYLFDATSGDALLATQYAPRATEPRRVESTRDAIYWPAPEGSGLRLMRSDVASSGARATATALWFDSFPTPWAVSTDGDRFAGLVAPGHGEPARLEVYDLVSGRLLRATRLAPIRSWNARLEVERDGFRLVDWAPGASISSHRIERDGTLHTQATSDELDFAEMAVTLDTATNRVVLRSIREWRLLDAETLAEVASARPPTDNERIATFSHFFFARFSDGATAAIVRNFERGMPPPLTTARAQGRPSGRELLLYSPSGELLRRQPLPAEGLRFTGFGTGHTLLFGRRVGATGTAAGATTTRGWLVERFDLDSGARQTVARDLEPLLRDPDSGSGPALLRDDRGRFFALDADADSPRELPVAR